MLARHIIEQGGTLISEYPVGTPSLRHQLIARNRIVAGLAQALLITEAAEKSDTLHTARFALEQGRDVLAVPGSIFSSNSAGTNNLISSGVTPVTSAEDVLYTLGIDMSVKVAHLCGDTAEEQALINLLQTGISDSHELLVQSMLSAPLFSQALTMLEISGKIHALGNNHWAIK